MNSILLKDSLSSHLLESNIQLNDEIPSSLSNCSQCFPTNNTDPMYYLIHSQQSNLKRKKCSSNEETAAFHDDTNCPQNPPTCQDNNDEDCDVVPNNIIKQNSCPDPSDKTHRRNDEKNQERILPYKYQVHGHNIILKWTAKTVLKHTNEREERFYATLDKHSEILRLWIPKYKGPIHIKCFKDGEGVGLKMYNSEDNNENNVCRIRVNHGKMEVTEASSGFAASYFDTISSLEPVHKINISHINPWATFTLSRQLPKLADAQRDAVFHRFLVLEDINRKFSLPNILDLKMGTIPLGSGDKLEVDRLRKEKKWSSTTSATVGVRVDGMQVFSPEEQCFHCYNKFYGYALDATALEGVFEEFLRNYEPHTQRLIATNLLLNLERLKRVIESLLTYRFYSASIIIFCEGRLAKVYNPLLHEERPILSPSGLSTSSSFTWRPKRGETFDSSNKESSTEDLLANPLPIRSPSSNDFKSSPSTPANLDSTFQDLRHPLSSFTENTDSCAPLLLPYLDIRLLDFEHTTFQGFFPTDLVHSGPDQGFLMGLSFLMKALNRYLELHPMTVCSSTSSLCV